jgi:hypothetical protein
MLDTWKTVGDPFERNIWRDDFRSGSKPDLPPFDRDVRFAALNGLKSDIAPCPKSANNGLMHRSKLEADQVAKWVWQITFGLPAAIRS